MRKYVSKLIIFFVMLFSLVGSAAATESSLEIAISGSSPDGYQLLMNIPYEDGMNADFSDIRFYYDGTYGEGGTELPYWVENYTSSDSVNVWVPIPYGESTVYCEWGIAGESTSESNISAVMLFGDDFTDGSSKWNTFNASIVTVGDDYCAYFNDTNYSSMNTTTYTDIGDYLFEYDFQLAQIGSYGPRVRGSLGTVASGVETKSDGSASSWKGVFLIVNSSTVDSSDANSAWSTGTWYNSSMRTSTSAQTYVIGGQASLSASASRASSDSGEIRIYIWDAQYGNKAYIKNVKVRYYDATPVTYSFIPLRASFTANHTIGSAPLDVQFNDTSTNNPTSWSWSFGDGNTSTDQNPMHTYTADGVYTVSLNATNAIGSNTSTQANYISVGALSGTVYDSDTKEPIAGAVVYAYSVETSASYVTGTNGSYVFGSFDISDIYYVIATATGYDQTPVSLPTNYTGSYASMDIYLKPSQSYFAPSYTVVKVTDVYGIAYTGVTTTCYEESDGIGGTVVGTGFTDQNGEITFKVTDNVQYIVWLSCPAQSINTTSTFTGGAVRKWIVIDGGTHISGYDGSSGYVAPEDNPTSALPYITVTQEAEDLNMTYSYINQTITALPITYNGVTSMPTLSWSSHVYSINWNGTADGNFSATYSGSDNETEISTIVPVNATYMVNTTITHPYFTDPIYYPNKFTIDKYDINPAFDFGWENSWNYQVMGYILMLLTGGLFGQRNKSVGIVCVIGVGLFLSYIGWFQYDLTGSVMAMVAILAGLAYILTRR